MQVAGYVKEGNRIKEKTKDICPHCRREFGKQGVHPNNRNAIKACRTSKGRQRAKARKKKR